MARAATDWRSVAPVTATRHNLVFYICLCRRNRPGKVQFIASMHKLLILNTASRDQVPWWRIPVSPGEQLF